MTSNIKTVSSSSHPISFEFGEEPTQGVVTLQPSPGQPAGDFVLLVKLAKPHQLRHRLLIPLSRPRASLTRDVLPALCL
jgi:hypothetical protein